MIRQLIREMLLNEIIELSPRTDLYHRTTANLQPRDFIEGQRSDKYRENRQLEQALENARVERFPDKPSRIGSAFASLVPRSRFGNYGQLYRVALVPGDQYHVADSMLIDKLLDIENTAASRAYEAGMGRDIGTIKNLTLYDIEYFGRSIIDEFWRGVTATKENLDDIEVMAPRFRVLEKVSEGQAVVRSGDTIELGVEIAVSMSGAQEEETVAKMKEAGVKFSSYGNTAYLPVGTIIKIRSAIPGRKDALKKPWPDMTFNNPWSDMTFNNPWKDGEQTYSSILRLDSDNYKKLSKSIRNGVTKKL